MKREFLVVHDYGMGGLWAIVYARSEAEVMKNYREVQVVDRVPRWLDNNEYENIKSTSFADLELGTSKGWISRFQI